ncbi:MAG: DEAD/DEAH box helicase [Verrucomicrobia bacterium]|nr:DEAD/DEAH box helicase [Verrucomicrobiota bacterium]
MAKLNSAEVKLPSPHDWRTTDTDEINKRRQRARDEAFTISNTDSRHPIFTNFRVASRSGQTYSVEIRDVAVRQFACDCVDFRINGLGTCKHVEAVLLQLERRFKRLFQAAAKNGSNRIDLVPDAALGTLRMFNSNGPLPKVVRGWFDANGVLKNGSPDDAVASLERLRQEDCPELRISQEVAPWLENRRRAEERKQLRRDYELRVQSGEWPAHETKVPLFPYQREGMLHLAFTERALLADEMGLGKTIQAIAACALLHRLGQAQRVLVVTPASLKTEWEEQIQRFTELSLQLVFGSRHERLKLYTPPTFQPSALNFPFFTIVNYEQMLADALEVNARLKPDIVVLDEAQRIKNWSTKTTQAIKRLRSRYAFVLTGTPIENRIDELHSLMDFLNPSVLGPLFRFNREFYELDERGRPAGYRNLQQLHERIAPYMLRRRKAEVETELPDRTDRNHFVPLSPQQQGEYDGHEGAVARLAAIAKRRPLSQQEQDKLMRHLAMMRMVCDTNFILDPEDRVCPKLGELEKVLEECRENDAKVIVFSEWERMLELVRELCEKLDLGFAWHTGTVPQRRRRAEINAFKTDPQCRVFLSTDSGSTGLNLQCASVVINCDLPWNPAKLEQRIARAWRKHQTKPVTVINLVSEKTIEHKMLETLANKQALSDGVLDLKGNLQEIKLRTGRQAFLAKLEQLVPTKPSAPKPADDFKSEISNLRAALSSDRPLGFARKARERINGALLHCEERYPSQGAHSVLYVVVDRDAAQWQPRLNELHQDFFGPDKSDPLAPVQLEVVDRATHEALERLAAAGLISVTTRASRPLFPEAELGSAPPPLSPEERTKADMHRAQAARKLKMATLLGEGDLIEEARAALLDAAQALGRALAVETRVPEPATLEDALLPPLSHSWKEALLPLRRFQSDAASDWKPAGEALASRLTS